MVLILVVSKYKRLVRKLTSGMFEVPKTRSYKLAKNIKAPLKIVPCPTGVPEHVAIDVFEPLHVSQQGNHYGCLMVDRTSVT